MTNLLSLWDKVGIPKAIQSDIKPYDEKEEELVFSLYLPEVKRVVITPPPTALKKIGLLYVHRSSDYRKTMYQLNLLPSVFSPLDIFMEEEDSHKILTL